MSDDIYTEQAPQTPPIEYRTPAGWEVIERTPTPIVDAVPETPAPALAEAPAPSAVMQRAIDRLGAASPFANLLVETGSDDCEVQLAPGADKIRLHVGQSVAYLPIKRVGDAKFIQQMIRLGVALAAVKGDKDEFEQVLRISAQHMTDAAAFAAGRVVAWDWRDLFGDPLPPPSAEVFGQLHPDELFYLCLLLRNQAPAAEKNV